MSASSSRDATGLARASRTPAVNCRHPFSWATAGGRCRWSRRSARTTNRYVAALNRKNCEVVTPSGASTATMIGPITRLPLIIVEFSEIDPGRSARLTSVGSMADHAGALSALPMPTPSATRNSDQIGASAAASGNSAAENTSWTICIAISQRRRSKRSAITPAGIDSSRSGPSWANTSSPTIDARPVRSYT